ncbi:MAG: oxidoreductase [Deltaproteobacteria bacterium]|nr:MAG: oxidoreductase [Deltaproteobacteria bacterium]
MKTAQIGFIGTGVMGRAMCGHLLGAGHEVRVYNRTRSKAEPLREQGALLCGSPAEVARDSEVVFTIVGYPEDVEKVVLGEEGVLAHLPEGGTVVDMTTSSPSLAMTIDTVARSKGKNSLDAPVSGGDLGARQATLAIMVGGDAAVFQRCLPLFTLMGKKIQLMGGPGAGQHCKMANQVLIAGTMIGVVESLLYAQKANMDLHAVIDVIGSGAASSWSINNLGRRIAAGDFTPGFYIKHFIKDMGIALAEARACGLSLPGLALVEQFYLAAQAMGLEENGTQGLYRVLATMNNITPAA